MSTPRWIALIALALLPSASRAEFVVSLHSGRTLAGDGSWSARSLRLLPPPTVRDTSGRAFGLDPAFDVGFRAAYWSAERPELGVGIGVRYARLRGNGFSAGVTSALVFVGARALFFPSAQVPQGRLRPYALIGVESTTFDLRLAMAGAAEFPPTFSESGENDRTGGALVGGAEWMITKHLSGYVEFHHSLAPVHASWDASNNWFLPTATRHLETSWRVDEILFGVSVHVETPPPKHGLLPASWSRPALVRAIPMEQRSRR